MKKLITLGVVIFLVMSFSVSAAELSDIEGHVNEVAIQYLYDNDVISGYDDGTFKPDNTVNRAELLRILVGGKGIEPDGEQYRNCFPDVEKEWFAPYVCYAKEEGWVDGYDDGDFRPSRIVNKVEAMKMLVNSQGYSVSGDYDDDVWYVPFLEAADARDLIEEEIEVYGVGDDMSRGEISENIYRAMLWGKTTSLEFKEGQDDWRSTVLTNRNMISAEITTNEFEDYFVIIGFDEEGTELFAEITERNIGLPLAIYFNGELISAPVVVDRIFGGEAQIVGDFTEGEAESLAGELYLAMNRSYALVTNVVDGDTIDVELDGETIRIRLIGIDTPETVHPFEPVECFGEEASDIASEMLLGEVVTLEADETQGETDGYGRTLRYVFLEDGTNFNEWLVKEGYAYEYTYDDNYLYKDEFVEAQVYAEENEMGLWAEGVCEEEEEPLVEPEVVPAENYTCSSNVYNCPGFSTQLEAQAVYDYCMTEIGSDVHGLDGDQNDLACESLP